MSVLPVKIGFISCGDISSLYLRMCKQFEVLQIAACADLIMERAEAQATQYEVPVASWHTMHWISCVPSMTLQMRGSTSS